MLRADAKRADPLLMQRNIILVLLMVLAAGSWLYLAWQSAGMDVRMNTPTMGLQAPLFLAVWVIMMVAMMFPSVAPMVLTFHKIQSGKRGRGEAFVSTWVFVAAYLVIWTLAGVVAYAGAVGAETLADNTDLPTAAAARISGAIVLLAGIYQLLPLKHLCLAKCQTPLTFILMSWRDGIGGTIHMGLKHGMFCLGCCWLLFVIMFPLGIMNVAAMAVIALLIFAEKTLPGGRWFARISGAALMLWGATIVAVPEALTFSITGSGMSMS